MKKVLKKLVLMAMLFPASALAALGPGECPDSINGTKACDDGLTGMITTVSNTILLLVGVVAVLFLIIGGFQYVASSGNPEQVNKAKNTIFYAIIGIVVTLLAYVAVQFVVQQLT